MREAPTTKPAYKNRNGQTVIRSNHPPFPAPITFKPFMSLEVLSLRPHSYGVNGSDIFQRKCLNCQGGVDGLPLESPI